MKKVKTQIVIGSIFIMFAALLWAMDGVFIRPKLYSLPVVLVVFLEHSLGFLVLTPFVFLNFNKIKKLSFKSWGAIFWVSVFGGIIGSVMITKAFFLAISGSVTFATVVVLQKLQPFFALIIARIILGERLAKKFYLWALVAIISSYFIAFGGGGVDFSEIDWKNDAAFFAVLAAFSFGSSTVFGKRIVNHLNFKATTALRFGITSLLMFPFVFLTGDILKISSVSNFQWSIFALIVFTSGVGAMYLFYFGLRKVPASVAIICELFMPASSIVLDYFLNKNVLDSVQLAASFVLLFSVFKVVKDGRQKTISFKSKVIHGEGRGEELGFHTANLEAEDLDIPHGVYVVDLIIENNKYKGLMHFGYKEVFGGAVSLEVLIKDFSKNIYGEIVEVFVVNKIRDVKKFKNVDELKNAIKNDLKYLE